LCAACVAVDLDGSPGGAGLDGPQSVLRRIVTIGPNAAEIICELGACDTIVGVDKFTLYPNKLASVTRVGGLFDPDLEGIVSLRPDLIVLRGRSETVERLADRLGIRVYHDPTERLDQIPQTIRELGELVGRDHQAERLVEAFEDRIERITKRVTDRPRPRVFLTVARQPDRLADILTAGQGVFLTHMIEIAGGENIFGDVEMGYPQVSVESILTRRPDVIIELMPEVELTDPLRARIFADWRRWDAIPAVRNERVHILTDDHCLIPSPRYVEIIDRVSRILHPDESLERQRTAAEADRR